MTKLDGMIDHEEKGKLNYEVDVEGRDGREVARDFLAKNGLIPQGK